MVLGVQGNKIFDIIKEYRRNYCQNGLCLDNACKKVLGESNKEMFLQVKEILDTEVEGEMWKEELGENWHNEIQDMMMESLKEINKNREVYIHKIGNKFNNVVEF